ncbi:MAG: hypothetical protein ACE5HS_02615 [bacterium]
MIGRCAILFLIIIFGVSAANAFAQADSSNVADIKDIKKLKNEIILEEIVIEAIIEKPNVYVLPKRMESKFEEIEFIDRSFLNELKSAPEALKAIEVDYAKIKTISDLKKLLEKEIP